MTDEERALQLARREGFMVGWNWSPPFADPSLAQREARNRYPITVTRPRVVHDTQGWDWKVDDGKLLFRSGGQGFSWLG